MDVLGSRTTCQSLSTHPMPGRLPCRVVFVRRLRHTVILFLQTTYFLREVFLLEGFEPTVWISTTFSRQWFSLPLSGSPDTRLEGS